MTLDDPEHQNGGFYGLFDDFRLQDTFQERIAPNSLQIDKDKLHMKFSALNVDFDGLSLDFLCLRKPAHEGIKERYPRKSRYFIVVGHFFRENGCRSLRACCLSQQALVTSFLVVSTSMTLKDSERPHDFCDLRLQRTLQE